MKRSTEKRRSPAEIKADRDMHYGEMEERIPSKKAEEYFRRPAYQVKKLIREQGNQMSGKRKEIKENDGNKR